MKKVTLYREFPQLNLPEIDKEVQAFWKEAGIFEKSVSHREGSKPFVFYEGPPSANGLPGIHHVMSRTIKDLFCRYKTLKGFQVKRKGGWDTHGLPVELGVEKMLGINKDDIGKKISIAEYNAICRQEVMKYKDSWDKLTREMGYWVDLDNPYVTFEKDYIETLWTLLKRLYDKGLLYKGYTIQPYSPAAGTGLSSHELNLPGSYRNVKDTSVVAQFKVKDKPNEFFLAWTTTPWTLPSNTALTVGPRIKYLKIKTVNRYTNRIITVYLAKDRFNDFFDDSPLLLVGPKPGQSISEEVYEVLKRFKDLTQEEFEHLLPPNSLLEAEFQDRAFSQDKIKILHKEEELLGADLEGMRYEQLLPYVQPDDGDAFLVVTGDFVTTEEGTGIVHTAPSFGADDMKVAREQGIGTLTLVDKQGKFVDEVTDFAGRYVKDYKDDPEYVPVDVDIVVKLKQENRAFKIEKFEHNYPHCWRTDKPIIYYPLNSWFIKTTAYKERMVELNNTINWQPPFTGTGRFGNWLENLVDWNLSRSRFWGTPLPVWTNGKSDDDRVERCVGSLDELKQGFVFSGEWKKLSVQEAIDKLKGEKSAFDKLLEEGSIKRVSDLPDEDIDLHRPFVDEVFFVEKDKNFAILQREADLIDVWFDSGAMPYAQWHYPFEREEAFKEQYPADFIAEGVDQTRGWFFTLHALAVMLFDSVAFKNVVANGLVLDKNGNKMSKRLGNSVDPFETLETYGADATRWYMMVNSQPWDNLKFDTNGIDEVRRKFLGTLFNSYSFFALYANIDGFKYAERDISHDNRPEIDRWIMSLLNSLVRDVDGFYADYEPTKATRAIQAFVVDHLSNWYVRLCRRRFWKGEYGDDKVSAYQTLYACLETICLLMAPVAPMLPEALFRALNDATGKHSAESVHLADFPVADAKVIDKDLEERMQLAQDISSMVLSLRKKENIKVRQPLAKIMIPVLDKHFETQLKAVEELIKSEVNVKEVEYLQDTAGVIVKKVKPDFKQLGKKLGPKMKVLQAALGNFTQEDIVRLEAEGYHHFTLEGETVRIEKSELEITSEDIPGWLVANEGELTVALDITITDDLLNEGHARELVNRIQRLRKDKDFNVTDRIKVTIESNPALEGALNDYKDYICSEILAVELIETERLTTADTIDINDIPVKVHLQTV